MTGIDTMVDDIRKKMMTLNPGLTEDVVVRITNECHANPAWHAARWVADIVARSSSSKKETLIGVSAVCRGLRFIAKERQDLKPSDYEAVLKRTLQSIIWVQTPEMRVLTAMLKAAVMVAEAWTLD